MSKGTMITRHRYCMLCTHRYKDKETGTICRHLGFIPIERASNACPLLTPFDKHKEQKEAGSH